MKNLAEPSKPAARWKTLLRTAFIAGVCLAAIHLFVRDGDEILDSLARSAPHLIVLAFVGALAHVVLTGVSWKILVSQFAPQLSYPVAAKIFFVGQIGKYLPGSIWSFVASAELAKSFGLERKTTVATFLLALMIGIGAGSLVASATVPQLISPLNGGCVVVAGSLVLAGAVLHPAFRSAVLRFFEVDAEPELGRIILSATAAIASWFCAGLQVLLIARAMDVGGETLGVLNATGFYAAAWVAGFAVFFAPAGIGAREAALIVLLSSSMTIAEAAAIGVLARLCVTAADFLVAGASLVISKRAGA